jgi:hypothetical protein
MSPKRLFVGAGALVLLVGALFVFAKSRGQGRRPNPFEVERALEQSPGKSNGSVRTNPVTIAAAKATNKPAAKPPLREKHWKMPAMEGVNENDSEVVELAISSDGSRVLAKGKKQICLFEAGSGELLQTITPPANQWIKNPGTERMFLSEDARVIAGWMEGESGKPGQILFVDAEKAQLLGAVELEKDLSVEWEMVSFSQDGRDLFVPAWARSHDKFCVQVIPVAGGASRVVELPTLEGRKGRLIMLAPIPGRQAFVGCWSHDRLADVQPSKVSILDLNGENEQPLAPIGIEPFRGLWDRRLWISADGNFVALSDIMKQQLGSFVVANLRTGEVATKYRENLVTFDHVSFLPDGKRMVVEWDPHFETMYFNALPTAPQRPSERPRVKLWLYEIATGKKLAEYAPPTAPRTLALSRDGKKIAFSGGAGLFVMGFKEAFGVD